MCEKQGHLARAAQGQNDCICVMDGDGSDIVNLTKTPDTWENLRVKEAGGSHRTA